MMWLNGELVENGAIAASSAGALSGWGVFTTLGIREGKPRFLCRHFARLQRDARAADVTFEWDFEATTQALQEVLMRNRLRNGLARLTLTQRGEGRWNAQSGADFSILALETSPPQTKLRVQLSPFRVEARRPLPGVKTTSYLPYWWAWRGAQARGFDEAILREGSDFLSEGARSTLFWVAGGVLHTPSLETGCLAGIGRDLTLEWARECALEVRQGRFAAREAQSAAEIWLISAASGPRPVTSWHGEEGGVLASFTPPNAFCSEFARWFEARDE